MTRETASREVSCGTSRGGEGFRIQDLGFGVQGLDETERPRQRMSATIVFFVSFDICHPPYL